MGERASPANLTFISYQASGQRFISIRITETDFYKTLVKVGADQAEGAHEESAQWQP